MSTIKEKQFTSNAQWPHPEVKLGTVDNVSTDYHYSREDAEAICRALMEHGFGGNGKIAPIRVWVGAVTNEKGE